MTKIKLIRVTVTFVQGHSSRYNHDPSTATILENL